MIAALLLLALAATPAPPQPEPKPTLSVAEQVRLELKEKIVPLLLNCTDLIQVAGIQNQSSIIELHVAPTGKVAIGGHPPAEPFSMLVWRCGLAALGPSLTIKERNLTTQESWDWGYTSPPNAGTGLAWVADDPKTLDREILIATDKSSWARCEHKDAGLTWHGPAKDLSKLQPLPDFKTPITDADTDTAPFWKVVRSKDGKHEISAHRATLPAFAKPLAHAAGLDRICDPVRALGEKAGPLLTARSKTLAACLKHRHNDLWLTLTLSGSGAVTKADARATAGLDDKALDCLEKLAAKWAFPYKGESGATLAAHLQAAPPGE